MILITCLTIEKYLKYLQIVFCLFSLYLGTLNTCRNMGRNGQTGGICLIFSFSSFSLLLAKYRKHYLTELYQTKDCSQCAIYKLRTYCVPTTVVGITRTTNTHRVKFLTTGRLQLTQQTCTKVNNNIW